MQRISKQADTDYAEAKYLSAEIEYLNVLKLQNTNAHAMGRLGEIYLDQGSTNKAYFFLNEARKLDPSAFDIRLKLGLCYLVAGEKDAAVREAKAVLAKDGDNIDAMVLMSEAVPLQDITAMRLEYQNEGGGHTLPGHCLAESVLARRQGDMAAAEKSLGMAKRAAPDSVDVANASGELDLILGKTAQADADFKRALDLSRSKPSAVYRYAEFKLQEGDRQEGQAILRNLVNGGAQYLPANLLLAQEYAQDGNFDESERLVTKILAQDPTYPNGMILEAEIKLKKGQTEASIQELEKAKRIYPDSPKIEYQLARAYLVAGAVEPAMACLDRALKSEPGFADAVLLSADTNIRRGNPGPAVLLLKRLVQTQPHLEKAQLLLASGFIAEDDYDDAKAIYDQLAAERPTDPEPAFQAGIALLKRARRDEAAERFSRALAISRHFAPAIEQLALIETASRHFDAALQRLKTWKEWDQKNPMPVILAARVYAAQHDWVKAEAMLNDALLIQPTSEVAAYTLAQVYFVSGNREKAKEELTQVVASHPKSVPALMLLANIQTQTDDVAGAIKSYREVTEIDPHAGFAFNNLAWLYLDKRQDLDDARSCAEKARIAFPSEPHVADTLGWVLLKAKETDRAIGLLRESLVALPDDPDIEFHYGVAAYTAGNSKDARRALEAAKRLNLTPQQGREADDRLALLSINPISAQKGEMDRLEAAAEADPSDVIVLEKLALISWQHGSIDRARDRATRVLSLSPKNAEMMGLLARVDLKAGEVAKAQELAGAAHKLAPENVGVSETLAQIAMQNRNYDWAASLLQDCVAADPTNAAVHFDLANCQFALGRLDDALASMRAAVTGSLTPDDSTDGREFVRLVTAVKDGDASSIGSIAAPKTGPEFAVEALRAEQSQDWKKASRLYAGVLGMYPKFSPAQRALVLLCAEHPGEERATLVAASSALDSFPTDPAVVRACGFVAYRLGLYEKAVQLLDQPDTSNDAERLFYLGMAKTRLNRPSGEEMVRKALAMNLRSDLANEARQGLERRAE